MKRIGILLTLSVTLFFSSLVYAEDVHPGSVAIGVHGIGAEWNYGRPMLRWRPSDSWAFDFTPVARLADGNSNSNYSGSAGSSDYSSDSYGLNVGIVKLFRNIGGVSLGWRVELGYSYYSYSSNDNSGSAYASNDRRQIFDLGFGPDLEYFVPVVPGLSIGASAQIHYRYISDKYASTSSITSSNTSRRENNLDLLGELLTIRYYF